MYHYVMPLPGEKCTVYKLLLALVLYNFFSVIKGE